MYEKMNQHTREPIWIYAKEINNESNSFYEAYRAKKRLAYGFY